MVVACIEIDINMGIATTSLGTSTSLKADIMLVEGTTREEACPGYRAIWW
jgi:hypothetical protein